MGLLDGRFRGGVWETHVDATAGHPFLERVEPLVASLLLVARPGAPSSDG